MIDPMAVVTPETDLQAATYLTVSLTETMGQVPPEPVGVYLLALAWIETAQGKAIINNNPGNLYARGFTGPNGTEISNGWSGEVWRPDWYFDDTNPIHAKMLAGQAPSAFRSYADPQDGWNDFVALLMTPAKRPVLLAAMADDPLALVRAANKTYSKDYTDASAATIRQFVADFRAKQFFAAFKGTPLPGGAIASSGLSSGAGMGAAGVIIGAVALLFVGTLLINPRRGRR